MPYSFPDTNVRIANIGVWAWDGEVGREGGGWGGQRFNHQMLALSAVAKVTQAT